MPVTLQRISSGKYVQVARVNELEEESPMATRGLEEEEENEADDGCDGRLDLPMDLMDNEQKADDYEAAPTAAESEMHNMILREYLWFSSEDVSPLSRQICWFLAHKSPSDQLERYVASAVKLFFDRYSLYLERFTQHTFRQRLVAVPMAGASDFVEDDHGQASVVSVRQGSLRQLQSREGQLSYIGTGTRMVLFVLRLLDYFPDLVSNSVIEMASRRSIGELKLQLNAQRAEPSDEWVIRMLDSVIRRVVYPVLYGLAREEVANPALQVPMVLSVLRALSVTARDSAQLNVRVQPSGALRFVQASSLQNMAAAILYCLRLSYVFAALPAQSQGDDFAKQSPGEQRQMLLRSAGNPVDIRATLRRGDPLPGSFLAFQELKRFSGLCKKVAMRVTQQVKVLRVPGVLFGYQVGERTVDLDGLRLAVRRLDAELRRAYIDFGEFLMGMSNALNMSERRRSTIKGVTDQLIRFLSLCTMENASEVRLRSQLCRTVSRTEHIYLRRWPSCPMDGRRMKCLACTSKMEARGTTVGN